MTFIMQMAHWQRREEHDQQIVQRQEKSTGADIQANKMEPLG